MCFSRICVANSTREAGAFFHVLSSLLPSIFWCFKNFCLGQGPVHWPHVSKAVAALTKKKGRKKKKKKKKKKAGAANGKENTQEISSFTLEELLNATKNFSSECLGEGGFGKVYKGYLDKVNQVAAIKKLNLKGFQGSHEFSAAVDVFRNADHPNLVKMLGFCVEKEHRLLVYEYMALGSLDRHLFDLPPGRRPLDWKTRIKIAIDVTSGLQYLHDKMIHGINLKSSNILLGEGYHVKLSYLGMARVHPTGDESGHLAHKSDIHSLGVVLLELITGRLAYDPQRPLEEQILIEWVRSLYMRIDIWKYAKLVDPLLKGKYDKDSIRRALRLALWCVNSRAIIRPDISEVVQLLSKCHPPKNSPSQIHLQSTPKFTFRRDMKTR